jgi:hypothetical protein
MLLPLLLLSPGMLLLLVTPQLRLCCLQAQATWEASLIVMKAPVLFESTFGMECC